MTQSDQFLQPINAPASASNPIPTAGSSYLGPATPETKSVFNPKAAIKDVTNIQTGLTQAQIDLQNQQVKNAQTKLTTDQTAASNLTAQQYADRAGVDVSRVQGSQGNFTIGPAPTDGSADFKKTLDKLNAAITKPSIDEKGYGAAQDVSLYNLPAGAKIGDNGIVVDANGNPLGDASNYLKPTPGTLTSQIQQQTTQLQTESQATQDKLNSILNGTFPLTADQQAQLNNLQTQYTNLITQQTTANQAYTGGVTASLARGSQSELAQFTSAATINKSISDGTQKIADLNTKMGEAISTMKQGFMDEDYKLVQGAWDDYNNAQKEITANLQKMSDDATAAQKATQDKIDQAQKDVNSIALEAAKNGASKDVIAAINGAKDMSSAIAAAGDSLFTASGTLGDYLIYKRQAEASGIVPETYEAYKQADEKQKSQTAINQAVAIAKATANLKATGSGLGSSDITNLFNTLNDYNGAKYITQTDLTGYTNEEKSAIITAAKLAGINTLSPKDADALNTIKAAQANLADFSISILPELPTDAKGQPIQVAKVQWNKYLQTNSKIAAYDTWKAMVIPLLGALKGTSGGGGGAARLFATVGALIPADTDTVATAQEKIKTLNKLLDNGAAAIVPQTTADKLNKANNNAAQKIADYGSASKDNQSRIDQLHALAPDATPSEIMAKLGIQ